MVWRIVHALWQANANTPYIFALGESLCKVHASKVDDSCVSMHLAMSRLIMQGCLHHIGVVISCGWLIYNRSEA